MSLIPWSRIFKDPVSASTHFAGFLAAIVGSAWLIRESLAGGVPKTVSMAIYSTGLMLVFLASSCYHFFDLGERGNRWLRRLDHAAIFLMIAGSYVPPMLHYLDGAWRTAMLWAVGSFAFAGIVLKMAWAGCPRWLSTVIYVAMGWLVVAPAHRIVPQLTDAALTWLIVGGAAYSIGAVVYATKRPDPWPKWFGFHEVWHVFVLVGAGAHFAFMQTLLTLPVPGGAPG